MDSYEVKIVTELRNYDFDDVDELIIYTSTSSASLRNIVSGGILLMLQIFRD